MTDTVHRMLPLYEGKMIHHYDHRWATYEADGSTRDVTLEEKQDPDFMVMPRYWVREEVVNDRLEDKWDHDWLLGWRDICRSTDERTTIATIVGEGASPEGGLLLALADPVSNAPLLLAAFNSFVFDFVSRQKVGGTHLKYFTMRQLPVPSLANFAEPATWSRDISIKDWVRPRVVYLVATSIDLCAFATDFNQKISGWHSLSREVVRSELDAAMFHLYGVGRDDVDYIMDTFPIVKRKDEAQFGEYRTKRLILEIYDQLAEAERTGVPYESPIDDLVVPAGESDA